MVQKIHPRGVIWWAFFPSPVDFFSKKKSAECSVHLNSSPWLELSQIFKSISKHAIYSNVVYLVKVRKYQKQIVVSSILPKKSLISALASKKGSNKKMSV